MAEHPLRFADRLAAEFPGVCDEAGRSPFWDAVGRRFFNLDYPQAEKLSGGRSKSFIAELMPQYPIYVPLLPPDAQLAIGQLHLVGELPFKLLLEEGFDADTYIDIFDGGPTVEARVQTLATIRENRRMRVRRTSGPPPAGTAHLIANTSVQQFRATIAEISPHAEELLALPAELIELLELADGDDVRIVPLRIGEH
jgi:arginine N-succinyltransferase